MSTKRACDAFGTTKDVIEYEITITSKSLRTDGEVCTVARWNVDLSLRGLDRLEKFIKRGTSLSSRKEAVADAL